MNKKFKIFATFGVLTLSLSLAVGLNNTNNHFAVKALDQVEISGEAALCTNESNHGFSFTMADQGSIPNQSGAYFTLQNLNSISLTQGQNTYHPTNTDIVTKEELYTSIQAFKFFTDTASFGVSLVEGDLLTFTNATFVREDSGAGKNYVVTVTNAVFSYCEEDGWSSYNGKVSGEVSLSVKSASGKDLRFNSVTMPSGLFGCYGDYYEYVPVGEESGLYVNNIYQSGAFLTYLPTKLLNTAWGSTLIYDGKTARGTFKDGDVVMFKGTFQLSIKTSSTSRALQNSYFDVDPIYLIVKNNEFQIATTKLYEVECTGYKANNAMNYWFNLTDTDIPNGTVLTVPSRSFVLIRDGVRNYPANDNLSGNTFIQSRMDTIVGAYYFAIQNSWFGGSAKTAAKNDQLLIGGDAFYKNGDTVVILRIKQFISCYDGSKWYPGHKTTMTSTWADDNSSTTFSFTNCEVCGAHIDSVVVIPEAVETPATCTTPKMIGLVAKANVEGLLRVDSKQVPDGDPLGHAFGVASYEWNDDYSSCTGTRTCTRGDCHEVETVKVKSTYEVIEEPKCFSTGIGRFTATFDKEGYETQTHDVILDPSGHIYSRNEWKWASDYSSATVTFKCLNCEDSETKDAVVTSSVTQVQSCTKGEITSYNATVEFKGKIYVDTKIIETKPAAGHTYGDGTWVWDEEYSSATLTVECTVCHETFSQTVDAVIIERKESTDTVKGYEKYEVKTTIGNKEYSEVKTKELPLAPTPTKKGCGGSIATTSALLSLIALLGISALFIRKKYVKAK